MFDHWGFVKLFSENSRRFPDTTAVVFAHGPGAEQHISYGELHHRAREIATWLTRREIHNGKRVLLLYDPGIECIKSFLGCLYAGAVPIVAPFPFSQRNHLTRATGIALDGGIQMALTDSQNLPKIINWMNQDGLDHFLCSTTDTIHVDSIDDDVGTRFEPDSLAYLQYTQGANGEFHGIKISHGNLAHNLDLIRRTLQLTSATRFGSWLPLHHEAGLITALLEPLSLGSTTVLMSPLTFVRHPVRWLEMIDRHRIGFSCAPNYAYKLCVKRLTTEQIRGLDLSCWSHTGVSSQLADPEVFAAFSTKLAPAGFRPETLRHSFTLPEVTLFITSGRPGRPLSAGAGLAAESVDADGLDVRIVDPVTLSPAPHGVVGEIWIRGASVAPGYWDRPLETRRTFDATTGDGEHGFFRTSELGLLHGDDLYLYGHLDDILFVHGHTLYPHDIERDAGTFDALAGLRGAAFSISSADQRVVIVHEINERRTNTKPQVVAKQLKKLVGQNFAIHQLHVVFVKPGTLLTTEDGRIRRAAVRDLYLASALDAIYNDFTGAPEHLRNWRRPHPRTPP